MSLEFAKDLYNDHLKAHIDRLKKSIWFLIEWPYVDKVYMSSYNAYFSSKQSRYWKESIKLSLFEGQILYEDFRSSESVQKITGQFRGFMVLRPIAQGMVGGCVMTKDALKKADFLALEAPFVTTVNSVELVVKGFPYSSQDSEINTCAETVLWGMMEYLGKKYEEYRPVLPGTIIDTLKDYVPERQLPSMGLTSNQMLYALKKFGVESRIYCRGQLKIGQFENLLSTYVESGLPVILIVQNSEMLHAVLAIGHEKVTDEMIDALPVTNEHDLEIAALVLQRNIQLFDYDDIPRRMVLMDDNLPPYQLSVPESADCNCLIEGWRSYNITEYIVPFHTGIYLEAKLAKSKLKDLLFKSKFLIPNNSRILIRIFLMPSRTFKDRLAKDQSIPKLAKEFMLNTIMPGFIWVGELSNKELIKQGQALGLFVLDATEPANNVYSKSLIAALYQHRYYYPV
ncbi:hypothetical protein, partial [Chitinophaga sancti]|uniref:hypothetical protein n=1 Tax=Chitinophaga sancti TaxID=1004 RepID=UPI003F796294